ncbi:MAG: ADP-ribosylation factor-like protein [Methanolinea sp.]|nr:ADP-ribosylation factor-like protein [Methanolinea sp.]
MIRTGIAGIDEMIGSGIPRGSRVLYSMEPGVDGRLFMMSTLEAALSMERRCLVVIPTSTADAFKCELLEVKGLSLDPHKDSVTIIDCTARKEVNRRVKGERKRRTAWRKLLQETVKRDRTEVLFVYFDLLYEDLGLEGALEVLSIPGVTVIVENLNLEGEDLIGRFSSAGLFDLIISMRSGFSLVPIFSFFTIEYVAWASVPRRSIPYISEDRHLRLYIPKIIVTGPPSSGKSTFVANASDRGISVDRGDLDGFRTTVAMDLGWLHFKGFDITIYGTPGQPRFDPIIPQLVKHAMGIILVLDSTRPDTLDRARELLELGFAAKLPLVVVANKSDLPHEMNEQQIRKNLKLREDVPIFFMSALKRSDVHYVVESMVDRITRHSF